MCAQNTRAFEKPLRKTSQSHICENYFTERSKTGFLFRIKTQNERMRLCTRDSRKVIFFSLLVSKANKQIFKNIHHE